MVIAETMSCVTKQSKVSVGWLTEANQNCAINNWTQLSKSWGVGKKKYTKRKWPKILINLYKSIVFCFFKKQ